MELLEYVSKTMKMEVFDARGIILAGKVYINGAVCTSYKFDVKENDDITIRYFDKKYVTRSGLKLERAIEKFELDISEKTCIDIGASEGGFTDCLLQNGAERVYAVDVAYGIFNWKLRTNDKVVVLERTNARYLSEDKVPEKCDIITIDVAFISIEKILPNVKKFLKDDGIIVALFKPQFELPKECLKKNGNIDNPELIVIKIVETISFLKENQIFIRECTASPIHGNNGNIEFLLYGNINNGDNKMVDEKELSNIIFEAFNT